MLFKTLLEIKIEIKSRLYCINIYEEDCTFGQNLSLQCKINIRPPCPSQSLVCLLGLIFLWY